MKLHEWLATRMVWAWNDGKIELIVEIATVTIILLLVALIYAGFVVNHVLGR